MTNDKQEEVWRKEFLSCAHTADCLAMTAEDILWQGFLMAKQSMRPIELPADEKPELTARDAGYNLGLSDSKLAITAAGYSYEVKE